MKQKFTLVDVAASAACVRYECLRMRLANVYDTSNRSYIFKLYESGGGSGSATKVLLLLEAGARFHTTSFSRESQSSHPNSFALKLRKHLRGRRLSDAQQVGCDRVLDLSFGFGDSCHHVILELYGQGNIILCDAHYRILSLLRSHRDDNKGIQIMPKFFYPFQNTCRPYSRFDHLHVVDALRNRSSKGASAVLSKLLPYGATYANSFAQTAACELDYAEQNAAFPERVADKVLEFERWLERLSEVECRPLGGHKPEYTGSSWRGLPPPSGYIIYTGGPEDDPKHNMYEEFAPFELVQFGRRKHDCFDRFSIAADEYFSRIESQRLQAQRAQAEQSAMNKLERVRSDVNRRVEGLRDKAIKEETSARLLEKNLYEVGQAIDSVNALITSGLSWSNVGQVVQDEQRRGNHIACLIHSLDLPHNTIKLHLTSETDSDNDDETADNSEDLETRQTGKSALVNVDLNLSAYGNASKHFEARKVHEVKRGKTLAQSDVAVKQAQQKTNKQLQAARTKSQVKEARKEHFFEKFRFFISSEGFLVLAGRDAQQNDMLVKRYMSNGDVYIHADVQGAASIVVRNRRGKEQPIPPLTLQQAGQFCICHSQAWNNGIVTSAWWVHPHQVSKSAPTGEYLQTGAFMIRGKKNYLPPSQLVLGFTFLFRVDESSLCNHVNERFIRGEQGDEQGEALSMLDEKGEAPQSHANLSQSIGLENYFGAFEAEKEQWSRAGEPGKDGEAGRKKQSWKGNHQQQQQQQEASKPMSKSKKKEMKRKQKRNQKEEGLRKEQPEKQESEISLEKASVKDMSNGKWKKNRDPQQETGAESHDAKEPKDDSSPVPTQSSFRALKAASIHDAEFEGGMHADELRECDDEPIEQGAEDAEKDEIADDLARLGMQDSNEVLEHMHSSSEEEHVMAEIITSRDDELQAESVPDADSDGLGGGNHDPSQHNDKDENTNEEVSSHNTASNPHVPPQPPRRPAEERIDSGEDDGPEDEDIAQIADPDDGNEELGDEEDDDAAGDISGERGANQVREDGENENQQEQVEASDILKDQNVPRISSAELEKLEDVDALTGQPREDDVVLYALPMCAPYSVVQQNKYKAKITPGGLKRGKAAKQGLHLFVRTFQPTDTERELMQSCSDTQLANAMIGNARIASAGAQQVAKKIKAEKAKKAKKNK